MNMMNEDIRTGAVNDMMNSRTSFVELELMLTDASLKWRGDFSAQKICIYKGNTCELIISWSDNFFFWKPRQRIESISGFNMGDFDKADKLKLDQMFSNMLNIKTMGGEVFNGKKPLPTPIQTPKSQTPHKSLVSAIGTRAANNMNLSTVQQLKLIPNRPPCRITFEVDGKKHIFVPPEGSDYEKEVEKLRSTWSNITDQGWEATEEEFPNLHYDPSTGMITQKII